MPKALNRKEAVLLQAQHFSNASLPEICLGLRAAINGASDPWPAERVKQGLEVLEARQQTWDHNHYNAGRCRNLEDDIDLAVFEMVLATIRLVKAHLESQQ